jgi:hypothetical protein
MSTDYNNLRYKILTEAMMSTDVFWVVTPCSLVCCTDVLEEHTTSIFNLEVSQDEDMNSFLEESVPREKGMEAVNTSETSVNIRQRGAASQNTAIFILSEISGSHGGEYKDDCLLGCCAQKTAILRTSYLTEKRNCSPHILLSLGPLFLKRPLSHLSFFISLHLSFFFNIHIAPPPI